YRVEVTALRFGIQRSERERGLAGTGDAGEYDELAARNIDIDVLEVVLACAAHLDAAVGSRQGSNDGFCQHSAVGRCKRCAIFRATQDAVAHKIPPVPAPRRSE